MENNTAVNAVLKVLEENQYLKKEVLDLRNVITQFRSILNTPEMITRIDTKPEPEAKPVTPASEVKPDTSAPQHPDTSTPKPKYAKRADYETLGASLLKLLEDGPIDGREAREILGVDVSICNTLRHKNGILATKVNASPKICIWHLPTQTVNPDDFADLIKQRRKEFRKPKQKPEAKPVIPASEAKPDTAKPSRSFPERKSAKHANYDALSARLLKLLEDGPIEGREVYNILGITSSYAYTLRRKLGILTTRVKGGQYKCVWHLPTQTVNPDDYDKSQSKESTITTKPVKITRHPIEVFNKKVDAAKAQGGHEDFYPNQITGDDYQ